MAMDMRLYGIIIIIILIFVFYALINQFDESVFNPNDESDQLATFMSIGIPSFSKQNIKESKPLISIKLIDRIHSKHVVVGYCCDKNHLSLYKKGKAHSPNTPCKPQKFVTDIAEGTFLPIKKEIIYQECTKQGTNPYINQLRNNSNFTDANEQKTWYKPDLLLCQGYFYDDAIIEHRSHFSNAQRIEININEQMQKYHHLNVPFNKDNYAQKEESELTYEQNLKYSIRLSHSENKLWQHYNRSFLTTFNTEYWGGGKCKRYDIIFESVYDRTSHGCVSIYIPPAFFFESERMHNNTEQLILPSDIVYNGGLKDQKMKFSPKQMEYIERILSFKDPNKFALFLVRDCYKSKYFMDAILRPIFFDILSANYRNVTSLGGCRRNWAEHKQLGTAYCPKNSFDGHYILSDFQHNCSGYGWTDGVVQMARPYKFFITFENSKFKGYSTEKIFNALYANAVPIYFGDPMITQYLNKDKFIHCNTITDEQIKRIRRVNKNEKVEVLMDIVKPIVEENMMECVEKVKKVNENDDLYYKMLLAPVFVNNTYKNTVFDPQVIGEKVRYALKLHDSYLVKDIIY